MYCLKIRVFGKVQGVFYRATAKQKASELGIYGWVRNEPDGSVTIWAEGEQALVERMASWSKKGSSYSRVDRIETEEHPATHAGHFSIKHS